MQLDVLSVLRLPASGPFILQESSDVTLKVYNEHYQRGFSCLPACGLFACNRRSRYARSAEGAGVQFALATASAKPSAWVLQSEDAGQSAVVRLEQLRGHSHQPPPLPAPHDWPADELLRLGLPPNFEQHDVLADESVLPPSTASCHVLTEPQAGLAVARKALVAHAFWRHSCPGKLVLAVAKLSEPEWQGGAAGGDAERVYWQWQVLTATGGYEYVGPADRRSAGASPLQTPRPEALPALAGVRMAWHPHGGALALCLTDSASHSCVVVLAADNLQPLWHRRWEQGSGPTIPAGPAPDSAGAARVSALSWVRGTALLAVLDDSGNLSLLDARGATRTATLLCGAIKYGESSLIRLGPILGKAGPLPGSAKGAVTDFPRLSPLNNRGSDVRSDGSPRSARDQLQSAPLTPPQPQYSLAFGFATEAPRMAPDGSPFVAAGATAATAMPLLAVCNGDAVALVRMHLCDGEPATPHAADCGLNGVSAIASPFTSAKVSSQSAAGGGSGAAGDSPEKDAVAALPGGSSAAHPNGLSLRLDTLDPASSFGSSAVSTPYMLGLQRASSSAAPATPLRSLRSNVSDAYPPPAWPLVWRTVLTLPAAHAAAAAAEVPHGARQWQLHAAGAAGPPGSLAASSVAGRYAPSLGACPSPAGSTGNLRCPSLGAAPPGDAQAAAGVGAGAGGAGGTDAAGGGQGMRPAGPAAVHGSLVCAAPAALRALQRGDVLVLRGSVAEALHHYPSAHIYGFLPAFLALVHLHRVDAAARLLRAYATFTGQVASAAAAAAAAAGVAARASAEPSNTGQEAFSQAAPCCRGDGGGGGHVGTGTEQDGAVSPAAAAAAAGRWPSAAALRRQWQATMTQLLEGALIEHSAAAASLLSPRGAAAADAGPSGRWPTSAGGCAGTGVGGVLHSSAGGHAWGRNVPRHSLEDSTAVRHSFEASLPALKLRLPADRMRESGGPAASSPLAVSATYLEGTVAYRSGAQAALHGASGGAVTGAGSGASGVPAAPAERVSVTSLLQEIGSGNVMLSVPEEEVLEVGVSRSAEPALATGNCGGGGGGGASGLPLPPLLAPAVLVEGVPSPTLPEPAGARGAAGAGDVVGTVDDGEGGDADADADADVELFMPVGAASGRGYEASAPPRPLPPAIALERMLQVCLQLLMLACQAMALVTFSAHGAGRAAAAAAALDAPSVPVDPGSPRSPGGGVLSRQAMRRLSSTMRMRSLRSRSVSLYGSRDGLTGVPSAASFGRSAVGLAAAAAAAVAATAAGEAGGGGGSSLARPRIGSITSNMDGSITSQGGGSAPPRPPPSPPLVIGFPIPVVWQPLPLPAVEPAQPRSPSRMPHSCGSGPSFLTHSQSGGQSVHGAAAITSTASHGTNGVCGGDGSISLAASGGASGTSSPSAPPPPPMRLQLHHCAFDATRLWQDACGQATCLGQSAAAVYLKPSYAAGLLLMAHACSAQLQQQQWEQQQRAHEPAREAARQEEPQGSAAGAGEAGSSDGRSPSRGRLGNGNGPTAAGNANHRNGQPWHLNDAQQQQQQRHQHQHPQQHRLLDLRHPQQRRGQVLRNSGNSGAARVNWALLRASAAATHAAVVWQHSNDWHRAALLAFACANGLTQLGGGSADLAAPPQRRRRRSVLAELSAVVDELLAAPGGPDEGALAVAAGEAASAAGGDGHGGVMAAARAACLRMGQGVLLSQVGACQKMEVQDACGVLLALVALPRRLLGLHSTVHISLLQKVCTRVVDLLPKRVCITPLLPAGSVPPLLQLSHAGIRQQLLAHCGGAVARVLEELRLAAACGGAFVSLRDALQQIAEHSTVDSCVRMLLRWQGAYEGSRVDAAAARLADSVQDMMLLPDTADWGAESLLPPLQEAFVASGLMSPSDAAAVIKAALAATAAAGKAGDDDGGGALLSAAAAAAAMEQQQQPGSGSGPAPAAGPATGEAAAGVAGSGTGSGDAVHRELQDLDELALVLDLSQLQQTLLSALQPFLHEALPQLRGAAPAPPPSSHATGATGAVPDGTGGGTRAAGPTPGEDAEAAREDALVNSMLEDPGVISGLAPVELAAACLRLLLKLQWALHCRAQVCALMLRLVRLQAAPQAPPAPALHSPLQHTPPRPTAPPSHIAGSAGTGDSATAAPAGSRPASPSGPAQLQLSASTPPPASPRAMTRTSFGHRSFREYIQHMASEGAAAAASAAVAATSPCQSPPSPLALRLAAAAGAAGAPGQHEPSPAQSADHRAHGGQERRSGSPFLLAAAALAQAATGAGLAGPSADGTHGHGGAAQREGSEGMAAAAAAVAAAAAAAEMDSVQGALVAWTAALVRADVFHCGSDLQSCVLTVLTMVRACPLDVTAGLDAALRQRSLFNARLAEQVNRLKRSPPPPPPAPAAPPPAPSTAAAGRVGSLVLPGGAMAPAPSLATAEASMDITASGRRASLDQQRPAAGGTAVAPPVSRCGSAQRAGAEGGSAGAPGLPLTAFASGASMSMWAAPPSIAEERDASPQVAPAPAPDGQPHPNHPQQQQQQQPDPGSAPPPAPRAPHPPAHSPCGAGASPQAAVAAAAANIRAASLQLLEYYADPSGALPSGLSAAAGALASAAAAAHPVPPPPSGRPPRPAANASSRGLAAAVTGAGPSARGVSAGGGGGSPRQARSLVGRSRAFSRTTPHSTLLQCLVCELVRTAHSVTASVSWRATLEGGRGLASCFVHPALHGASGTAAAAALPSGLRPRAASLPQSALSGKAAGGGGAGAPSGAAAGAGGSAVEEVPDALGSVPGAEGAQALLLSLLDVRQWAEAGRAPKAPPPAAAPQAAAAAAFGSPFLRRRAATAGGGTSEVDRPPGLGFSRPAEIAHAASLASAAVVIAEPQAMADVTRSEPERPSPSPYSTAAAAAAARDAVRVSGSGGGGDETLSTEDAAHAVRAARALAAARARHRCSTPTPPESPQRSFSTLTDDGDTEGCYPTPTSTGGAARPGLTGLGRQGNSSLRQHNNPAYGLHSPTPSNLSEFWDEASELASPQSTRILAAGTGPPMGDGRPSNTGGRLWPWAVDGARSSGGSGTPGAAGARLWPADDAAAASDQSGRASTAEVVVAATSPQASLPVAPEAGASVPGLEPAPQSPRVALGTAVAGSDGVPPLSPPPPEPGAPEVKAGEAGTAGEAEQPPTLSYLVDVSMLAEIRNAVREAHAGGAPADGGGGGAASGRTAAAAPDEAAGPDTLPYAAAATADPALPDVEPTAARRGGSGGGAGVLSSGPSESELSVCGGVMGVVSAASARQAPGAALAHDAGAAGIPAAASLGAAAGSPAGNSGAVVRGPVASRPFAANAGSSAGVTPPRAAAAAGGSGSGESWLAPTAGGPSASQQASQAPEMAAPHPQRAEAPKGVGSESRSVPAQEEQQPVFRAAADAYTSSPTPRLASPMARHQPHGGGGGGVSDAPEACVAAPAARHSPAGSAAGGFLLQDFFRVPSTPDVGVAGIPAGEASAGGGESAAGGEGLHHGTPSPLGLDSEFFGTPASRFSAWSGAGTGAFGTPVTAFGATGDLSHPRPESTLGGGAGGGAAQSALMQTEASAALFGSGRQTGVWRAKAGATTTHEQAVGDAAFLGGAAPALSRSAWEAGAAGCVGDAAAVAAIANDAAPPAFGVPAITVVQERCGTEVAGAGSCSGAAGSAAVAAGSAGAAAARPGLLRAASAHALRMGAPSGSSAPASANAANATSHSAKAALHTAGPAGGPSGRGAPWGGSRLPRPQLDAAPPHAPGAGTSIHIPRPGEGRPVSNSTIPSFPASGSSTISAGIGNATAAVRARAPTAHHHQQQLLQHHKPATPAATAHGAGPGPGPGSVLRLGRSSHDAHARVPSQRRRNSGSSGGGARSGGGGAVNPLFSAGAAVALAGLGADHASGAGESAGGAGRGAARPPTTASSGRSIGPGRSAWH